MEGTDLELARSAAAGDGGAFRSLIDRHAPGLFRVARALTRTREDAEDVLQETFIGAHRGLPRFEGKSSVKTWLTQILTRQAAKAWHRDRHARRRLSMHAADDDRPGIDPAGREPGPAERFEREHDTAAMLAALSAPHREVLVLREVQGLTYDEMAAVLGVPRGTVESRLFRARAELKTRFGDTTAAG